MTSSDYIAVFAAIGTWVAAFATVAAVCAAIYNAKIAMKIATLPKRHEANVTCRSGFVHILPNNEIGNYYHIQKGSSTFVNNGIQSTELAQVLELYISNIGELPIYIESIVMQVGDAVIMLNTITDVYNMRSKSGYIDAGVAIRLFYFFHKVITGQSINILSEAIRNGKEIKIAVTLNLEKIIYTKVPNEFIQYITDVSGNYGQHEGINNFV